MTWKIRTLACLVAVSLSGLASAADTKDPADPNLIEVDKGVTTEIDCVPATKIHVKGDKNTLKLDGHCGELRIDGSGNEVNAEALGRIQVAGSNNKVSYQRGHVGGEHRDKAEVVDTGTGNRITKVQAQ